MYFQNVKFIVIEKSNCTFLVCINCQCHGDVAHMVERSLRMREVWGSIPYISISYDYIFRNCHVIYKYLYSMSDSPHDMYVLWQKRQNQILHITVNLGIGIGYTYTQVLIFVFLGINDIKYTLKLYN